MPDLIPYPTQRLVDDGVRMRIWQAEPERRLILPDKSWLTALHGLFWILGSVPLLIVAADHYGNPRTGEADQLGGTVVIGLLIAGALFMLAAWLIRRAGEAHLVADFQRQAFFKRVRFLDFAYERRIAGFSEVLAIAVPTRTAHLDAVSLMQVFWLFVAQIFPREENDTLSGWDRALQALRTDGGLVFLTDYFHEKTLNLVEAARLLGQALGCSVSIAEPGFLFEVKSGRPPALRKVSLESVDMRPENRYMKWACWAVFVIFMCALTWWAISVTRD